MNDARDWFVMVLVGAVWIAGTVWIYIHASVAAFSLWCGLCTSMGGIYHWLNLRDSKTPDAHNDRA